MKRVFAIYLASICIISIYAQHSVGVSTAGALAWQLDDIPVTSPAPGGGCEVGFNYHFRYKHFILQTGIGVSQTWAVQNIDSLHKSHQSMYDTEGVPFVYNSTITQRTDKACITEISMPVLLGIEINRTFYALVGTKLVLPVFASAYQKASLCTWGDYNGRYYEDFFNMPEHGYFTQNISSKNKQISFAPDIRGCLEVGGVVPLNINSQKYKHSSPKLHIGAFVEYGFLNAQKNNVSQRLTDVNYSQYIQVKMNHVYASDVSSNAHINNLRVGLRFTLLFPVAPVYDKNCNCPQY